jgi:transcription initiation factor IIE alpha subunit
MFYTVDQKTGIVLKAIYTLAKPWSTRGGATMKEIVEKARLPRAMVMGVLFDLTANGFVVLRKSEDEIGHVYRYYIAPKVADIRWV